MAEKTSYTLMKVLLEYAPDSSAQMKVTEMFNQMHTDGLSEDEVCKELINALADGVNHRNWVWVLR